MLCFVKFYEGYKGSEVPRSVILSGKEYPVESIEDRKRIINSRTGAAAEEFHCKILGKRAVLFIPEKGEPEILFI